MRVIMCQDRFADKVRMGTKRQTVRAKARCKPGDALSIRRWSGKPYRSKQEIIIEAICDSVYPVWIEFAGVALGIGNNRKWLDVESFAQADGFADWRQMQDWFQETHGLPFEGWLIRW